MTSLKEIGEKRQKKWKESNLYKVTEDKNKKKFYVLEMFPYPSGAGLHVGHPKWYIAGDVLARKKMLEGFSVLHPMGFDTFGLGTEQYAIDNKMKPQVVAEKNINTFINQLKDLGLTYDRDRSFSTADPDYYKRTQRIFLKMYTHYYDEKEAKAKPITELEQQLKQQNKSDAEIKDIIDNQRLAYVDYKPINRCPKCMTGLANEDLDDGKCERCASEVEQKPMRQRVLRITKYADRLITWLDKLNWDESMKDLERNWIGKSEWTQFKMSIKDSKDLSFEVYTTRIDTVFGMSFVVMAPEHPLVDQITTDEHKANIAAYKEQAKYKSQLERTELQKEKTGEFTWAYAINPFNGEEIPVYVGDYVLANYGTGVVMAVPAHDERDFEFAKKYDIKIAQSIAQEYIWEWIDKARDNIETLNRKVIDVVLENEKWEFLLIKENNPIQYHFVGWWIETWETELEALKKEIIEETWYTDFEIIWNIEGSFAWSYAYRHTKNKNQKTIWQFFYVKIKSDTKVKSEIDEGKHQIERIKKNEILEQISRDHHKDMWNIFLNWIQCYTEKGILVNSWEFSGLTSNEAIAAMQERLSKNNIGGKKSNFKIQDRVFSRQRYRGEPFPVVFCNHCNTKTSINFYNQETRNGIISWNKTIETRALNPEEPDRYFWNIKEGDIILAINKETNQEIRLQITKTYQRKNLQDLRENEDKNIIKKMYSNPENFNEKTDFNSFEAKRDFAPGYVEKINKNWLIGREIKILGPEIVPMKESDLPLTLPDVENYAPTGTEEWPLAAIDEWINTKCPHCGKPAKRESNTMPGRAGSSRYRLRYMDNKNDKALVSPENEKYRGNVDVYVGGAEHVTRHMIYARFRQKFLFDIGVVTKEEPFEKYHKVWLIMAEDGRKMSKRRGNVVLPDSIIEEFWADTLRTYEMFMGPFDQAISRNTNGIKGIKKFLDKIIALQDKIKNDNEEDKKTLSLLHQTIKKLTEDIDGFKFNTAIAQLMILVNHLTDQLSLTKETFQNLIILIAPFAPHLAEELWEQLGNNYSVFTTSVWPSYNESYLVADMVTLPVQFNGKMRGTLEMSKNAGEKDVLEAIAKDEKLSAHLTWSPKKVIYIPGKIINIIL